MNHWWGFERRWRDRVCEALLPGFCDRDHGAFWTRLGEAAPPMLAFGFRASVWVLRAWPVRLAHESRFFLLRQMVLTLKFIAVSAHLSQPEVRASIEPRG